MSDIYTHWVKEDLEKEAERLCEENEKLKRRIQLFKNTRNEQVFAKLVDAYEKIEKMQEAIDALVPVVETYVNPIRSSDVMFSMQYHNEWRNEGYKALTKAAALKETE